MSSLSIDEFFQATGGSPPIRIFVECQEARTGKLYYFHQPFVLVGAHRRADLLLDNPAVASRQLYLQILDGRLFAVHLSNRVATLWGNTAKPFGWIDRKTEIHFGGFTLRFPEAGEPATKTKDRHNNPTSAGSFPGPPVTLELQDGRPSPTRVTLNRRLMLVGNERICKLRPNSSRVSGIHCSLVRTKTGLWVVDLAGREGVQVSGATVRAARLDDADQLQIGGHCFTVHHENDVAPAATDSTSAPIAEEGTEFKPTELELLRNTLASTDTDAMMNALVPIMDRYSNFQAQTFEQFQQMMATMIRAMGGMFNEHRDFVREELDRLDSLTRSVADKPATPQDTPTTPTNTPAPPTNTPAREREPFSSPYPTSGPLPPGLSVPLPPLSTSASSDEIHAWLQQRISELGTKESTFWNRMVGILRTKPHDPPRA